MTGNGMSQADQGPSGLDSEDRSELGTPSTSSASTTSNSKIAAADPNPNIQEARGDTNQWIKRPRGLGVLGQQIIESGERVEDPVTLHEKLGPREFGILQDYMNMWTRSIRELLNNVRDMVPKEGILGEVHYWRDLARVLDAICKELKFSFVETSLQILVAHESDERLQKDVKTFFTEKDRVSLGNKEAQWNNKYMKILESPVQQIESADDLRAVELNVGVLMKTCNDIFMASRFYKEARMVSFLDRLLQTITDKIKRKITLGKALQEVAKGNDQAENFLNGVINGALQSVQKFDEGFFIKELMEEQDSLVKVQAALGNSNDQDEEQKEERKAPNEVDTMQQSFYRKQGIDFLNFQRPGTAYGSVAFQQAAANSTSTSFYSKNPTAPAKKSEIKVKSLNQLWIDRADKILDQINHLYSVLDFIQYGC